jgi:hypothetical protein
LVLEISTFIFPHQEIILMKKTRCSGRILSLIVPLALSQTVAFNAYSHDGEPHGGAEEKLPKLRKCHIVTADRLFDGVDLHADAQFPDTQAVLIVRDKVAQVGRYEDFKEQCRRRIRLGNATIMPGFIESHAHVAFQNVGKNKVLEHGITTVQDTGGPLQRAEGGNGRLRLLSVGPIIQAAGGYPINIFGGGSGLDQIGYEVGTEAEARNVVNRLVDGGAAAIKIALEPGGEEGAPWMLPHGEQPVPATPWPILSPAITAAIVDAAHHPADSARKRRVIAHVGENAGFAQALAAGVDEFAHMPCSAIDPNLLTQAANTAGLAFVSTVDTLASCATAGLHFNTWKLATEIANCEASKPGQCAQILYGSEIGHDNVPWGINGEELHMMLHLTSGESVDFDDVLNVLRAATSKAGKRLGVDDKLGTLSEGAPADVIAVRGNPLERFKLLEYPDLVMSGGRIIVNRLTKHR